MSSRISTPELIAAGARTAPLFLRLPDPALVFAERAARLRALAPGHALGDFLSFIATLCDEQHAAVGRLHDPAALDAEAMARAREFGMPPLGVDAFPRDPRWRDLCRGFAATLAKPADPARRATLERIAAMPDAALEQQADRLLGNATLGVDPAAAPFVAAALQVHWVVQVSRAGSQAFGELETRSVCPCCGSRPVASLVLIGSEETGHRYLECSLCAAQWHMVRIICAYCTSTKGIEYLGIEGSTSPVKAECCDECGTYLKIVYRDKDPLADACADDLASLALDLLVAETGKASYGNNLMIAHGEAEG